MTRKEIIVAVFVFISLCTGHAFGDPALPVSPSGSVGQNCPTFSWSAAENATAYRIEVYEANEVLTNSADEVRRISDPVLSREIPAPALSWTPSSPECLPRGGKYVWYVRGIDAEGRGQWSGPRGFEVESSVLSLEQHNAVREIVKEYVSGTAAIPAQQTTTRSAAGATTVNGQEGLWNTWYGWDTGGSFSGLTEGNSFFGRSAGSNDSTGAMNTAVGDLAGSSLSTTSYNSFFGAHAGQNSTGSSNNFFGYEAGYNAAGSTNTFIGYQAGYQTTGSNNIFTGYRAGYTNSSGQDNVYIGDSAGYLNNGTGNVFIGRGAGGELTGVSNRLYIANSSAAPLIYGEFDTGFVKINGTLVVAAVASPSDERYKKNIMPLDRSLDKVLHLKGVRYEWRTDEPARGLRAGTQIGLIAQDVEKILPELVMTDNGGYKMVAYDKVVPVLIEAVKEQQGEIRSRDARVETLERALEDQQRVISSLLARLAVIEGAEKRLAAK